MNLFLVIRSWTELDWALKHSWDYSINHLSFYSTSLHLLPAVLSFISVSTWWLIWSVNSQIPDGVKSSENELLFWICKICKSYPSDLFRWTYQLQCSKQKLICQLRPWHGVVARRGTAIRLEGMQNLTRCEDLSYWHISVNYTLYCLPKKHYSPNLTYLSKNLFILFINNYNLTDNSCESFNSFNCLWEM